MKTDKHIKTTEVNGLEFQRKPAAPRGPVSDPALGRDVQVDARGVPPHRLVAIGDSVLQGFQSGAVFHTDVSVPAIVAYELGWLRRFRYPRYAGPGGLPLNIELLLRDLERALRNRGRSR